jgi:hypothetical protein
MPHVVIHVQSIAGSPTGWPVGWGFIPDTLTADGSPVEAVVLMEEPALPGARIGAWPVALAHFEGPEATDEVMCVAEVPAFASVIDLEDVDALLEEPQAWAAAGAPDRVARPPRHRVASYAPRSEADLWVATSRFRYLKSTGCLD